MPVVVREFTWLLTYYFLLFVRGKHSFFSFISVTIDYRSAVYTLLRRLYNSMYYTIIGSI